MRGGKYNDEDQGYFSFWWHNSSIFDKIGAVFTLSAFTGFGYAIFS